MKAIWILSILLCLSSCSGPTKIDSSSNETFENSIQEMSKSLNEDQRVALERSVQEIALAGINLEAILSGEITPGSVKNDMKQHLHGKTADDIIKEAERLVRERTERQIVAEAEQRKQVIAKLEKDISDGLEALRKSEDTQNSIKHFEVLNSKFYWDSSSYFDRPIIDLSIKNSTKFPVAKAHFYGVLQTPGRTVPWISGTFSYEINGGLEPGEEASWKLLPNSFGEWSNAPKNRNDMVLTVTVTRIDDVDGNPIFEVLEPDKAREIENRITKLTNLLREQQEGHDSSPYSP